MSKEKLCWEQVSQNFHDALFRAKVPGGWLLKTSSDTPTYFPDDNSFRQDHGYYFNISISFYPDPLHSWDPEII